jgi:hypothetical protein
LRNRFYPALIALFAALAACEEQTPTGTSEQLLPASPVTVEVLLPWSAFATGHDVFGGFGTTADAEGGLLANRYRGSLDARTLGHFEFQGLDELVTDTTGTLVHDSILKPSDAHIVVFFDTLASSRDTPVTLSAHRTLMDFDPQTTTWTHAVDSSGDRHAWGVPGGGPSQRVGEGVWDRSTTADSMLLPVDTAAIRAWSDTLAANRGFRIDVDTEDVRLEIRSLELRYKLTPSVRPDTTLVRNVVVTDLAFIYTPEPGPPTSGLRVGGIPAWRSVIHTQIPTTLNGPAELCAALGCPFALDEEKINHASLVLTTRPTEPPGFEPLDSVRLDVRAVLAPERLPKSPLGSSLVAFSGRVLAASLFATPSAVSVPVTSFVRTQLAGESDGDVPPPRSLALLSFLEPSTISFVNFAGPGQPGEPRLRLILTASPIVELP